MVNYQNGLVYKLECKDLEITDIYVGSTCNFNRRKAQHKTLCTNENSKKYNIPVYQFIRANGGWFNWKMILIEEVPCQNKKQLNRIEAKYIKDLGAVLNCVIPCRTDKEYREDNKELLTEKAKKYREENKEIITEKNKKYYEDNKELLTEKAKKYREENKEIITEKKKKYREENKEIINEQRKQKVQCDCGSVIIKNNLSQHKKSIKHKKWQQEQN